MNQVIHLNDYDFTYVEQGAGQTVIFVHGSASDYRTWNAQLDAFAKDFHVVSYSRRYHWPNQSIRENQDYAMQQHIDDLKALIRHFTHHPVYLVGHSYGALMGIELACNSPDLLRKLVLVEPPAIRLFVSNVPQPAELIRLLLRRPLTALAIIRLGALGLGPAAKAARKGNMQKALQWFGKAALGHAYQTMSEERREQALLNLTPAELTGSGFLPIPQNELSHCKVPTLLLTGALSPVVFKKLADKLEELLPDIHRYQIPGASHIAHEDNSAAFNEVVYAFLKGNYKSLYK